MSQEGGKSIKRVNVNNDHVCLSYKNFVTRIKSSVMLSFVENQLYERTIESLTAEKKNNNRIVSPPTGVET